MVGKYRVFIGWVCVNDYDNICVFDIVKILCVCVGVKGLIKVIICR